jgi:hypothetical protein
MKTKVLDVKEEQWLYLDLDVVWHNTYQKKKKTTLFWSKTQEIFISRVIY